MIRLSRRSRIIIIYLLSALAVIQVFLPLYWMISTAFRPESEIYEGLIIPRQFSTNSIKAILGLGEKERTVSGSIVQPLINSTIVSFSVMAIATVLAVFGGYALARTKFPGKDVLSTVSLFTYIFPVVVLMVPLFLLLSSWGLTNTYLGLIIAELAVSLPYALWMLRGYFLTIPREIEEAAMIDGCTRLQIVTKIIFPLSTPAIAATAVYAFILAWNNVLFPLVLVTREEMRLVPIALLLYMKADFVPWDRLMAACFVASLPPALLFFAIQRYIVGGLTAGAVKG
ncbi:carbohydrate ABC transporter permease [Candidatus Bathyarchaeota archaeon]|nr:carbohydrate ABC transporter permease [Candidatus Bathyarchaeota archaeon]